ncbi:threonine ammonia-lyase IlvA [Leekyejoonella antrihumi]|uniref:L-threonine dehydratase n=1 Tax=Leekyejoonella antrihumi TaxID=1660198 RepID=A0A563E282_9MICO|nr:threonine ammonia-lyase IlvA [Leekyejoonella antrihumi]TWP36014.1 threonine ammonia-lyase IlvA [Leekyejoonella antrihumi]
MSLVTADDVDRAAARLRDAVRVTPLEPSRRLSALTGLDVWLKREDQQPVRSYKLRGAYNLLAQLTPEEAARGAVCASAGNHAQGVAYAAAALGIRARIYLPRTTPHQKRDRVRSLGADAVEMIIDGDTYDDAAAAAKRDAARTGAVVVPAFDDPRTIAGQGTVAREIVEQLGRVPDALAVPVGGGGLISGALTWLGERHPQVRVIGAEPLGAAGMKAAVASGGPVTLEELDLFVDGAAVRRVGDATYAVVQQRGPELCEVPAGLICCEMLDLYQSDGIIAEPAGALALAALRQGLDLPAGSTVVCVLSGGNNDVSRYADIVERALVHEGLKHYFLVEFAQEPGALRQFLDEVLGPDDDITRFEYVKRNNRELGPALVGIELGSPDDLAPLLARMKAAPPQITRVYPDSPLFQFLM